MEALDTSNVVYADYAETSVASSTFGGSNRRVLCSTYASSVQRVYRAHSKWCLVKLHRKRQCQAVTLSKRLYALDGLDRHASVDCAVVRSSQEYLLHHCEM